MSGSDIYLAHLTERPHAERSDEAVAPGEVFATVTGQRTAEALEFIHRDSRSFTVPYAYAPLLWWTPPSGLLIEYPGLFSVALKGRSLDELHRRIRDRKVLWVREFSELQAASLPFAVTGITLLRVFPSREAGA